MVFKRKILILLIIISLTNILISIFYKSAICIINLITIYWLTTYIVIIIIFREILIFFTSKKLNYNLETETFWLAPGIFQRAKYNLSISEIWNHFISEYRNRISNLIKKINLNNLYVWCNLREIYEENRWYDIVGILIILLLRLFIIPFKLLVTWIYFIDIFYNLCKLSNKVPKNELKLLKIYELICNYKYFDLILPLRVKNYILQQKYKVYLDDIFQNKKMHITTILYFYFISGIFISTYYTAFRRWENIIFLVSTNRHMYNLCSEVPLFNEYIYRHNNSIPHDINQIQHTIRKKKTRKLQQVLLLLIYITFEHIWVIDNFCYQFIKILTFPGTRRTMPPKNDNLLPSHPTIYDELIIGYKSIYICIFDLHIYKIYFRSITTMYVHNACPYRSILDLPKSYITPVIIKSSNKGLYVLRPIEVISRTPNVYMYYYDAYSHVKTIDCLSLMFLER